MRKTYTAPSAESVSFDTEEILDISFLGTGFKPLVDKKPETPSNDFGNITLF